MEVIIKELSPNLLDDYLLFFDQMVFTENPHWSKCYCYSFHFMGADEEWTKSKNRSAVIEMIKENKLKGYLAYYKNTPIGWCNVNDRANYEALKKIYDIDEVEQQKTSSVVCFLIRPEFRNKGVANKILQRLIIDYSNKDYSFIEAYPAKAENSCEKNYKGPLSIYENNGFRIISDHKNYHIVRLQLN